MQPSAHCYFTEEAGRDFEYLLGCEYLVGFEIGSEGEEKEKKWKLILLIGCMTSQREFEEGHTAL